MTAQNNSINISGLTKAKGRIVKNTKQHQTAIVKTKVSSNLRYGQKQLLKQLPLYKDKPVRILEIGCENGDLLQTIAKEHPYTSIIGIDKYEQYIKAATQTNKQYPEQVELQQLEYETQTLTENSVDIAVLSYTLSQSEDWDNLIQKAYATIRPNGYIAVVDFHKANLNSFRQRMAKQAIQMDATLLPLLRTYFTEHYKKVSSARLGVWEYFVFIGRKDIA